MTERACFFSPSGPDERLLLWQREAEKRAREAATCNSHADAGVGPWVVVVSSSLPEL